jgi:hypothetical protein
MHGRKTRLGGKQIQSNRERQRKEGCKGCKENVSKKRAAEGGQQREGSTARRTTGIGDDSAESSDRAAIGQRQGRDVERLKARQLAKKDRLTFATTD